MSEDLNKRVEQAAQGVSPQTKPDERRRYLGSLRERVLVRLDNTEVKQKDATALFLQHINDYAGYTILINSKISNNNFLNQVESLCSQKNIQFTLVSDETAKTGAHDTAVLVVAAKAINKMRIEIKQVYSPEFKKESLAAPKPAKKKWWHRLFHRSQK